MNNTAWLQSSFNAATNIGQSDPAWSRGHSSVLFGGRVERVEVTPQADTRSKPVHRVEALSPRETGREKNVA